MNNEILRISKIYDRHLGVFLMIFIGYLSLISNISEGSYLVSIISMNFTIASLVLAILALSESLTDEGVVFLKYSSNFLIASAVGLFYLSVSVFHSPLGSHHLLFRDIIKIGSSFLFAFGIHFLILGSMNFRPEVDTSLKDAYLKSKW
ncbi:hypothetical protein HRED_03419, partial [Candidatus Haloredivivus sp. G17]